MKNVLKFVAVIAAFTVVVTVTGYILMMAALWLLFDVIYQR